MDDVDVVLVVEVVDVELVDVVLVVARKIYSSCLVIDGSKQIMSF